MLRTGSPKDRYLLGFVQDYYSDAQTFVLGYGQDYRKTHESMTLSKETTRQYNASWNDFKRWCDEKGLASLPAELSTVENFLIDRRQQFSESTLRKRLLAINHVHDSRGEHSPTEGENVSSLLRDLAALSSFAPRFNNDLSKVLSSDEKALLDACDGPDKIDRRDKLLVMLLIAFDMKRSQATGLQVGDITNQGKAMVLRSELDSGRRLAGHRIESTDKKYDLASAFQAWIEEAKIKTGPLLRSVDRHGNVGSAMSEVAVYKAVRKRASQAGLENFSPMMLRTVPEK